MRTLIIDDSRADALNLHTLLERMPGIATVTEAHSLAAARAILEEQTPDVVFLDIELGHSTGFQLLPHLSPNTKIILTTVHTDYGPQAYEANAVDYLVKPIAEERLLRAIARLGPHQSPPGRPVLVFRGGSERLSIPLESIAAVQADGDHSLVYCGSRRYADHRRFREWVQLCNEHPFTQLDRSTLVRRDLVHSWIPYGNGLLLKFSNSPQQLEIGRAAAKRFLSAESP